MMLIRQKRDSTNIETSWEHQLLRIDDEEGLPEDINLLEQPENTTNVSGGPIWDITGILRQVCMNAWMCPGKLSLGISKK